MTHSLFASAFMGLLHVAVPSYGLRLNRLFGSRQVGWALVAAFLGLALFHLVGGVALISSSPFERGSVGSVVGAVVPILLLIGMAHIETLFRERARVERDQRLRHCELGQFLEQRTAELADAKEEFHRELNRRDHEQRVLAQRAAQERLALGARVAARAGQHLNRFAIVMELYAKVLLEKKSRPGTTQYEERLLAQAAEARDLAHQWLACGSCEPLRIQLLSLGDLIRRHLPALQKLLSHHQVLEFTCPANTLLVWADPQVVRQVLEEVIRNSRNAMSDAGRVSITLERVNLNQPHRAQDLPACQFCAIIVTDTGCGMDREVQRHLGEPFFTTKPGQHAGLGLASVSGLVKEHGGWLAVASAPGSGTKVHLCFPQA